MLLSVISYLCSEHPQTDGLEVLGWFGKNSLFSDFQKPFLTVQEDDIKKGHTQDLGIKSCVIYTGFPVKREMFKIICLP